MNICEITLHSCYLLCINLTIYWKWCLDGPVPPLSAHFQQNKKQNDGISESVDYAVLNQYEYIMTEKDMFKYSVELMILLICLFLCIYACIVLNTKSASSTMVRRWAQPCP